MNRKLIILLVASAFLSVFESEARERADSISVGMGVFISEDDVAGAVSTIHAREVEETTAGSISTAMAGLAPGLFTIQGSGEPGSDASTLYIRGVGTYGTTAPLIIIDGFPLSKSDLDTLDPNEIKSISIVKDASTSSLYGIQGANGIIVITTKRGSGPVNKAPAISFSMQQGVLQATRWPETMDPYDQAVYFRTLDENDGAAMRYTDKVIGLLSDGSSPVLYPHTNWFDTVLNKISSQQRYNINISGSAGKSYNVRYFLSAGYLHQGTLLNYGKEFENNYHLTSGYNRYSFRSNVDFRATRRLLLAADFSARLNEKTSPYTGFGSILSQITSRSPNASAIFNPDGSIAASSSIEDYSSPNPYGLVTRSAYCTQNNNQMTGTIRGVYSLDDWVDGLSISGSYNFKISEQIYRNWNQTFDSFNYLGQVLGEDAYSQATEASRFTCSSSSYVRRYTYYNFAINYSKTVGRHSLKSMLYGSRTLNDLDSSQYTYAYQGLSARVAYSFDNRVFTELNMGFNGSENFHPARRYGFFPSLSVAWIVNQEPFIKIRSSYGLAGNDQVGSSRFLYISEYSAGGQGIFPYGYYFGTNTNGYGGSASKGYNESQVGNEYVSWETARKFNLGVDVSLLKDKSVSISADYFHEIRDKILTAAGRVPDYIGIDNVAPRNSGKVRNQGVDLSIRYNKSLGKDFQLSAGLMGVYARNKVLENDNPTMPYDYQELRGLEIGYSLGYQAIGFFKSQEDIAGSPKQSWGNVIPGDVKYQDTNKNGTVDVDDRVPIKCNALPRFTGSVMLGFTWNKLDFNMIWSASLGGTARLYPYDSSIINSRRWSSDNSGKEILPVPHTSGNNALYSNLFIMKTDYLKLRNVEIGYIFNHVRLYFNIQNALTFDRMLLKDRDSETAGGASLPYPILRVFNLGVKIGI